MYNKQKTPEDFSANSPLRKPMFFEHFSGNIHKYSEMVSFFRWHPDIWYDYLSKQSGKQIFFFRDYQRVMLRSMARFITPYYCIPRGGSKCITGDTRILTAQGYKKIEDIIKECGLPEYSDKETIMEKRIPLINMNGKIEYSSHIMCNGKQDVLEIKTYSGYSIKCTKNHPLLTVGKNGNLEWKEAKDITNEDYICIFREKSVCGDYENLKNQQSHILDGLIPEAIHGFYEYPRTFPDFFDEDFALFVGYLIGDGMLGIKGQVGFTNIDKDILQNYFRIAEKYKLKITQKADKITYNFYSTYFQKFLELCDVACVKAQYKHIPKYLFTSPLSVKRTFLQGIFDTDGFACKDGKRKIGYCSSSYQLVRDAQLLLLNFGIIARIKKRHDKTFDTDNWVLSITGKDADNFRKEIGFTCKRKQEAIDTTCEKFGKFNTNIDIIPNQDRNIDLDRTHGLIRDKARSIYKKETRMTYSSLEMLKEFLINKEVSKHTFFYDKIESVREIGQQLVYDVCMPETHSFIANGIVNHNTLIDVMYLYHRAIFYPGSKLGITSGTKEQIVSMWREKHTEILRFFPAIKKEICWENNKKPQFSKDTGTVNFKNGSWIMSTPVIQATKGGRRTAISKEESALIDHTDYRDIVSPMMQGSSRIPLGATSPDPEELNGQEMSMTTSGYRNSEEFESITNVYKAMVSLKGGFLFGADWRLPYRVGGADKNIVDKERQDNETEFRKNYLCEWVGTVDGAIIRMDRLIKARTLRFEDVFKIDKKADQAEYVMAVDVAGTGTDTTSICIGRVLKQANGKIDKVHIVGLYTIPTSGNFKSDAIFIKKLFLKYGGSYEMVKSKIKGIVVDANAIGQGLVQELMNNHYDIETNTQLGSFDLMFESSKITRKPENKNSPKIIWDLMVSSKGMQISTKNHEIIVNFMNMFNAGNVLMLGTFNDVKQAIVDKQNEGITDESKKYTKDDIYSFNLGVDWLTIETQCNQVTAFINEVTNIKLGQSNEAQPRYTIKRINNKITKDKFSSISYMLYFAKLYLDEEEEPQSENVDDYVTVGFGRFNTNLYY